jgi:glycosyltransferase involved in cell wall biosynthesis
MKTVSIIIPAYNEEKFIGPLIEKILAIPTEEVGFKKEIIVVNDGSKDRTGEIAASYKKVRCINQENQGKGRAVQRGVKESTGDYILVQDSDLEYDPADYLPMLRALSHEKEPVAIYGSRTMGQRMRQTLPLMPGKHPEQSLGPWVAGLLLTGWTGALYGKVITDTLTAYKLYPADVLKSFDIKTHGFETDHEITAKLIKKGIRIIEVPIAYRPRSREEGKKIKARDGFVAVATLLKFRFGD